MFRGFQRFQKFRKFRNIRKLSIKKELSRFLYPVYQWAVV